MSWRLILTTLLIAAGASAWGGLQLGDWLIANGPAQIRTPDEVHPELASTTPVLNANGKPFVATAPQPLSNGTLGVPQEPPPVDWQLQTASLLSEHRPIALATTTITMDEATSLAQSGQSEGLQGIATLGSQAVQPIDITTPSAPPPPAGAAPQDANWQAAFQAELNVCAGLGFFSRPSCAWAARNKYCEPHKAWGRAKDCPAKN